MTLRVADVQVTQNFINYLQTNALVIELWGLQGKGSPRPRSHTRAVLPLSASPTTPSGLNAGSTAEATEASMEAVVRETAWHEERRQLQSVVHKLQQEIDFLQIEKGVLARVRYGL